MQVSKIPTVLLGLAIIAMMAVMFGCKSEKKVAKTDSGDDFKIEIPADFEGPFNPNNLEIGTSLGKLAPDLKGNDLDGREFKLSDYRGKVVMLDFWAGW
jgi:hypothetical protein